MTYRQLNGWDSKGALPSQRRKSSGWRKFDPKQLFVILVCAEIRKQFGASIEKLAWLQKFMLQDKANHFLAAVNMARHGLAVLILTDLCQQFDMGADLAIGELLSLGHCRYNKPQSFVLLLVNPLVNKILAALRNPIRLELSDKAYVALGNAHAATTVRDTAELAVLQAMRQRSSARITVAQTSDKEILLEIDVNEEVDGTIQKDQIPYALEKKDQAALISHKVVKTITREGIGFIAARLNVT